MNPEPHRSGAGTEPWVQWAGVSDDDGKTFHEIAQGYHVGANAYRELLTTDPKGMTSATQQGVANARVSWARLIKDAIGRRGCNLDSYDAPVQRPGLGGRCVPPRSTPESSGERDFGAAPVAHLRKAIQTHTSPITTTGVPAVGPPELRLSDVPLILEDLLVRAQQLVDSGAPSEAIEAILDHVAGLRDGRA